MQQRNESAKREVADSKGSEPSDSDSPASNPPSGPAQQPAASGGGSRLWFILLAVLAFAGMAYWYLSGPQMTQQTAAPGGAPPAPPVTVSSPLIETIQEWNDFTGQFEAEESVEIRARVSGYLESVNFDNGQLVNKGDLLFVIEPRPFEIALESAKADVAQAEAQLELAKVQLERTAELRKKDFASAQAFDERAAEVKDATASLNKARADLDQAQLNLDYTRVLAPVSGRVGRHEVSVGNLIVGGTGAPETTLLTTLVSLDPIWLTFNVSEGDAMIYKRLIQKGELQSARTSDISVEGQLIDETDWPLKGAIDFVDNQYSPTTGTIRVRASFPNKDLFISPGQFGRVRVPMSQEKPTMLVPDAAVVTDQSTKLLFTVADDGTVVPKPVELGAVTDGGLRIVREGITENDKIIINGLLRARPGQKVTPKPGEIQPLGQQAAAQR
ncbi:MAG: efflux RND transporter periplasmic adaptor subunit [Methyloceanibacter sp.]|nr:efflux RND transporter periplasmic adaptor subunit [Methyloceanibacter sp.]